MIPLEVHDRGRGPELKGTRLTVYDIIPYRLAGDTSEQIAEVFRPGYPDLTAAHIELLFRHMDDHYDEVMAVHWRIEERNARGNPPEIEEKLKLSRAKLLAMKAEFDRRKAEEAAARRNREGTAGGGEPLAATHPGEV
jgi:uncharacterized protein (DUF433 family)